MYDYKLDNCGPVYLTIGDGGNAEGLSRTFVDETNPATNATYCEGLKTNGGKYPNQAAAAGISWAPEFQRIVSTSLQLLLSISFAHFAHSCVQA